MAARVLTLLAAVCAVADAKRPSLSSAGKSTTVQEEGLGSQLLSAVLSDDVSQAAEIFAGASAGERVRLANAIDWRGKSVLMHASSRNFHQMVELLIQHNARVDASDYSGGATALMLAARNGSLEAMETLTAAGADVNEATPQGTTVLMQAVANASTSPVIHLLDAGADPNALDKGGASALSIAASLGSVDVIAALLAANARANTRDLQGSTPLLVAAAADHVAAHRARRVTRGHSPHSHHTCRAAAAAPRLAIPRTPVPHARSRPPAT